MTLPKKSLSALRNRAHLLKPVIIIGRKGLTEPVHKEIEIALEAHELLKIKVNEHDRTEIAAMTPKICAYHQADHVQTLGHIITIWRKAKNR